MFIKKQFLSLLMLITLTSARVHGMDGFDEYETMDFFEVPNLDDDAMRQECDFGPDIVLGVLTNPDDNILIQNFLQKQFYKLTTPVIVRSLFDDPCLQQRRVNTCDGHNQFSCKLFFNQMRKCFLSPCSSFIDSYLAFNDTDLLEEIDRLDEALGMLIPNNYDIPEVLPLFTKIKLEERRIGGMFAYQRRDGCVEWRLQMPIYYFEHNFFLTDKERQEIANAPLFRDLGEDGDNGVEDFLREHVVNDIFGLGDIRAQVFVDVIDSDKFTLALGAELDLPTTVEISRGIVGHPFKLCPNQPPFNYFTLACTAQNSPLVARQMGIDFGIGALDRLTQVAAASYLGSQHVGAGFLLEFFYCFDEEVSWNNKLRLYYTFPGNEARYFRTTKNPSEFDRDYADPDMVTENLAFLSEQSVLFLYPPVVIARTQPGIITQWSTSLFFDRDCVKGEIGYDFWNQGPEQLKIVDYLMAPRDLDTCKGTRWAAYQHKIFANVSVDRSDECRNWRFTFFGNVAISSRGIGKDWIVGLDLRTLF